MLVPSLALANPPHVAQSNTRVERKIQLFDTTIITPHNQYFTAYSTDNIIQTVKIERIITPKEFLIQRIEVPQRNISIQSVISNDTITTRTVEIQQQRICKFRDFCRGR